MRPAIKAITKDDVQQSCSSFDRLNPLTCSYSAAVLDMVMMMVVPMGREEGSETTTAGVGGRQRRELSELSEGQHRILFYFYSQLFIRVDTN
jgi:hypothetical protein